jgi:hypothetical protein
MVVFAVAKHFKLGLAILLWTDRNPSHATVSYLFLLASHKLGKHSNWSAVGHHYVQSFDSCSFSVHLYKFGFESCGSLFYLFFFFWESPENIVLM